jgi:hypothetical protein
LIGIASGISIFPRFIVAAGKTSEPQNAAQIWHHCSNPTNLDEILLAEKSVAEVGSYQTMLNWDRFIHDFNDADAGTYTLVLQIEDAIDHIFTSRLAVDAVQILTAPPLPSCIYTLAGDINRDCKVDFIDFAMMAENWLIDCNITPDNTACISPDPQ